MTDTHHGSPDIGKDRRNEVAKQALGVGMEDPYHLHNLSVDQHYHAGHEGLREHADQLRRDADRMEAALDKLESGDWTGAEAALFIAEEATLGDYDTDSSLYDNIPIQGREDQ